MAESNFIKRFPKPSGDPAEWEQRKIGWIAALQRIKLDLTDEYLWTESTIGYRILYFINKELDVLETV